MHKKEVKSAVLGESYFEVDHPSGLKIMILPKKDYKSTYAVFGTKYGSIDTRFKRSDQDSFTTVPEGIAHFLEHKLFESEDLDAFARYAKTGASANAYTSFDKTCYLFSCTDKFAQSLEILLDFVQHPYFTKETVEKEQGIIGQEIRMYDDEPNWLVLFNLLRCLYREHPVRIDIAGTTASISEITADLLYDCYHTFYNLNNMALCIAGNVDVEQVLALCDKYLVPAAPLSIERSFTPESREIGADYKEHHLPVSVPVFALGYKEKCETPDRTLRELMETGILLEVLAGKTSPLYKDLFEKGLINTGFGTEYFTGYGFESILFEGESRDPHAAAQLIKNEIRRLREEGIDPSIFEASRKKLYGREIMAFNDVDQIANAMISNYFSGFSLFDALALYPQITLEDIENRLRSTMEEQYAALSVVCAKPAKA